MAAYTESMLTTFDNPYDPFDDYRAWYVWDSNAGYNTSGLLARLTKVSNEMSDSEYWEVVGLAIDEILERDVLGIYKKIERQIENDPLPL